MKRNRLLFKMLAVAMLLLMGVSAKATTTIKVGTSETYTTIAAAYNSIVDATGGYVIELQSDYNPVGESYPIVLGAKTGATSAESGITIQPKAGSTAMFAFTAATEQLFDLNAATWVTIDGLDATKFVVNNTTPSATASQCVRITADASNNTIKNITAISICQKVTSGAIAIISAAPTVGCAGNTITNCTIKDDGTIKNTCGIYVSDSKSTNTTITNNNIENITSATGNAGNGINIASADGTTGTNLVSSNNIYWPTATTFNVISYGIQTKNARTKIESNYIGYSASNHTGTAELTSSATSITFQAIILNFATTYVYPVQYNTIANITQTGGTNITGIYPISGNLGYTINANTIENITITLSAAAAGFSGINNASNGTATKVISNNIIRNITISSTGLFNSSASAIYVNAGAANTTYSNNQIYNITSGHSASLYGNIVYGIRLYSNNNAASNTVTIERNQIYNLKSLTDPSISTGVVYGIASLSGHATAVNTVIVKNNMIALGADMSQDLTIYGIFLNTTLAGNKNYYFNNSVYIGGAQTAAEFTSKNTYAFYSAAIPVPTACELRNNIFANQRTITGTGAYHYAIGFATAGVLTSCDNNLYWGGVGSSPLGRAVTTDKTALSDWKDAVVSGSDAASFSSNPQFIAATNATPNLHINPMIASEADNNGVFFADVVTYDFDNNTRLGTDLKTDIGADEFTFGVVNRLTSSSVANTIYATNQAIVVEGTSLGSPISIYTLTGQLVKALKTNSDKSTIAVEKGFYIVKTANQICKVIVP